MGGIKRLLRLGRWRWRLGGIIEVNLKELVEMLKTDQRKFEARGLEVNQRRQLGVCFQKPQWYFSITPVPV